MREGSPVAQLVEAIRVIGRNEYDKIEYATVISPPPSLRIRVDNMAIDLDMDDIVVAKHLLAHKRTAITSGVQVTLDFDHMLPTGARVLTVSMNNGQKYAVLAVVGGDV